jgi:hypothetical protein
MRTLLYIIAFALLFVSVTGVATATQVYPTDPAPPGCTTLMTMNWEGEASGNDITQTHMDERDKPAPNCGMELEYQGVTYRYTGVGQACWPSGVCIDNYPSPEGSTWFSKGTAPGLISRWSIFNGVPLVVETPVATNTPTPTATTYPIDLPEPADGTPHPSPTSQPSPTPTATGAMPPGPVSRGCTEASFCVSIPVVMRVTFCPEKMAPYEGVCHPVPQK